MIGDIAKEQPKFKILKSPNLRRKQKKKFVPLNEKIKLEALLGLSVTSNSGLSLDGSTGNVAYFAGCVAVIYNSRKNKQHHLFNSSKKPLSCLAYSGDGRFLATGESGHQPAVRVWDLEEMIQVAEFEGHKFGIRCVAFSPNLKYIVSVGYQHDMVVNVWNWKKNIKVASNKVTSKVLDVAFSEDGSMFVTVGNRHVKFWYLNASKSKNQLETLPLLGRNGILGEHQNNSFCGVCCNKTDGVDHVFAITEAGMLCQFNDKRVLIKWVSLKTNKANALSMGDKYIFVGCSGGLVRIFSTLTLNFIASLPLPHPLGVDVAFNMQGHGDGPGQVYADTVAVRYDQVNNRLCSIYDDHSMYIWDVTDIKKIGKTRSFLYHNGAIWGVDIYPDSSVSSLLPINSFATCGNDDTIRFWRFNYHNNINNNSSSCGDTPLKKNIYSNELVKVLYIDKDMSNLRDKQFHLGKTDRSDSNSQEKNGIRCIRFRPDGKHLASGDRVGNIRMHDMSSMIQVAQIEAHDSEVLCLEFTSPEAGLNLLVSGSRDRLIHVFDAQNNYSLVQTLDEHSAAVTAVKFVISDLQLGLVSCSADKSILFRTANVDPNFHFTLARHVVSRTTLYDMEVDMTKKFVAIACQDRNIRIYNMRTGKMKKCYGGSVGSEGILIRLQLDPTSSFVATSSSDKTLALFNFFSGECTGHMMGHSEVPTGVRFFNDLRHLISVGADGCMFIWKMDSEMAEQMNRRKAHLRDQVDAQQMRRTTFNLSADAQTTLEPPEVKLNGLADDNSFVFRFSPGQLPAWARMKFSKESSQQSSSASLPASVSWNVPLPPKGKWAQNVNTQNYPLPPSLPYFGFKDVAVCSSDNGVPIIREDEIDHGDEEDDDDEFSRGQLLQVLESKHTGQGDTEDGYGDVEEEDDEDDNDGGCDEDAEKESNDGEEAKEDTVFLAASDHSVETSSENLFKVEENILDKFDEGSAGENENYLSYEEDVELKSVPSSPSSSEQLPKLESILFHGEECGDIKNLNLSHETFEMTLKRLEVEMTNKSEVRDRCSLSARYFNNTNNNDGNNTNNNDGNNNNNNNNNNISMTDAVLTEELGIPMSISNTKKDFEETKIRQAMNDKVIRSIRENTTGSLGRRQGRSLGGSELRLAADKPIEKLKHSSMSSPRKWKSLVDIRFNDNSNVVGCDGEWDSQRFYPRNVVIGKAQTMTGGQVKLKSILRSQTPNIIMASQTAASNSFSRQENSIIKKKAKRSSAAISMMTLNSKLEKETEPRKPLIRVRSYRMATESSQAKQQGNSLSKELQPSRRLLPRSAKQFQSTPNLVEDGHLPKNEEDQEDTDESAISSLNIQSPQFSSNTSNKEHSNKELETLNEDMSNSRLESRLYELATLCFSEKSLSVTELTDAKEIGLADTTATCSSNGEMPLCGEPMKSNISLREELEVPERDLNGSRSLRSSTSGLLKPTNQTNRPYSSNLQLKSQLQKRLLPSDPANKLSMSYIEPRSISSTKMLKLKDISSINSTLAQPTLTNQKQDDLSPKRVTSQSKWGSLKSPTNSNITFARPPSRNLYVQSPDPLQNWVKRAETIQHKWESRNNETSENGQSDLVSSKFINKKFRAVSDIEPEPRRWSIVHSKHSESMDLVTTLHEPSLPTNNTEIEFPASDRSRLSASNCDWNLRLENKNRLKHTRTSSADGSYQSDEALPREGEPSSSLRDSCNIKCRKDGIRPRVAFSPVVCMVSAGSTPEEEKALDACDRLEDAVNTISQIYEKLREFKEQDDPVLLKLKSTVEKECTKLQELVGPSQPSSQLDRCAEDLTMKMYELIRKKIDSVPTTF